MHRLSTMTLTAAADQPEGNLRSRLEELGHLLGQRGGRGRLTADPSARRAGSDQAGSCRPSVAVRSSSAAVRATARPARIRIRVPSWWRPAPGLGQQPDPGAVDERDAAQVDQHDRPAAGQPGLQRAAEQGCRRDVDLALGDARRRSRPAPRSRRRAGCRRRRVRCRGWCGTRGRRRAGRAEAGPRGPAERAGAGSGGPGTRARTSRAPPGWRGLSGRPTTGPMVSPSIRLITVRRTSIDRAQYGVLVHHPIRGGASIPEKIGAFTGDVSYGCSLASCGAGPRQDRGRDMRTVYRVLAWISRRGGADAGRRHHLRRLRPGEVDPGGRGARQVRAWRAR